MEQETIHNNNNNVSSTESTQQLVSNPFPQLMNMNMNTSLVNTVVTTTGTTPMVPPVTSTVPTTTTTVTPTGNNSGGGSLDLFGKKKRGRPRKYDADGNLNPSYKKEKPPTLTAPTSPPPGFTLSTNDFSSKKGRGKPTGFGNYQILSSFGEVFASTAAVDFTPHVVTVYTGEDVGGKILSFAQKSPRGGICILSANGAISKVALRQLGSSGGDILTYEGRFEILSLSGSYTVSDNSGMKTREGGLSVSLAGPDGRVIGGAVAGLLTAAGPIQIIVGSFMTNGHGYNKTLKRKYQREQTVVSPTSTGPETMTAARPISQANTHGENFMIPIMSHQLQDQIQRECASVSTDPDAANWNGSDEFSDQRTSPDINISLADE
ncbi:DNA binding protein [Trifolium pratense]|uniref:AT-hook motif nuclear-localized protein n=2 Tax=Trifolium TaxID=3898 RepID=A0A2K3MU29_TRIPR|nr:AT-hook motif nuclear-localized protein 1-like [Trifolium pratense]PNX94209.1 DNA binding protein [Trifolium pratense]